MGGVGGKGWEEASRAGEYNNGDWKSRRTWRAMSSDSSYRLHALLPTRPLHTGMLFGCDGVNSKGVGLRFRFVE